MSKTRDIELSDIRTDGGTQPRCGIDGAYVTQLAERLDAGDTLPAADVFHDGQSYWLADGFHRLSAHKQAGIMRLNCNVHQGTQQDAQWFSFGANKGHDNAGLRRTNEDKQRAVEAALRHEKSSKLSNRQIAEHVGVSEGMIRLHRESICVPCADATPTREVTRNGKTYEMNVSNIGTREQKPEPTVRIMADEIGVDEEPAPSKRDRVLVGGVHPKAMRPVRDPVFQEKVTHLNLSHDPEKAASALLSAFGESYCKSLANYLLSQVGKDE